MFEYHNNILCIKAAALYNKPMFDRIAELERIIEHNLTDGNQDAFMYNMRLLQNLKIDYKNHPETFVIKYTYENLLRYKKITRTRRGGYGREALISWESLPIQLKDKIIAHIGYDPTQEQKQKTFADYITHDEKAEAYYRSLELSEKQITNYTAKANILNAIGTLIKERESKRMAFGKKRGVLFQNICRALKNILPEMGLPARIVPLNYRRLMELYGKYYPNNYEVLLHGGVNNDNSKKIKGDVADWLLAAYCLPTKPKLPTVLSWYKEEAALNNWPALTLQAVNQWLNKPEIKRKWVLARHGEEEWKRLFGHTITRKRNSLFPNAYWAIDGTKLDWLHYDADKGVIAKLRIDVVFDVYSEKIIGYSYSTSEDHTDHFTAIKQAVQTANVKPYLFTYDNQSGHKTDTMQELYDKLVAKNKGTHYPHRAYSHSSPVEQLFSRFQQQVLNQWWWSDKQSPLTRTQDSKPNLEFLKENKHLIKSKEELRRAFEISVKLWNEAKHPHENKTRNEVYAEPMPRKEEITLLDTVDMFWVFKTLPVTYKRGGITIAVAHRKYTYEVYDNDNRIDIEFRRKYVGAKMYVKYDPEYLNDFIQLYIKNAAGDKVFVANAQLKRGHEVVPALMQDGDKYKWQQDYQVTEIEIARERAEIEALQQRTGITPEKIIEEQELMLKMGGKLNKEQRNGLDAESPYARL